MSDSWFALIVLTSLVEQLWLSSLFFAAHFLVMAAGLLWYIKMLVPSATTHEVHLSKEALTTTIAHTSLTKKGSAKRRVPTVVIASAALAALVLIGILVYPSSPLMALFANANSEVIAPVNSNGKRIVTLGALLPLTGASSSLGESEDAAIKIAIKNVNEFFSKSYSNTRVGLIIEDTQTNPAISLEKAVAQYGADKVGVYLIAFDEVVPIFIEAQNQPGLSMVKWYGSDGSALNGKLVRNIEAALFAAKTGFVNPIYGVDNTNSNKFKLIDNQIQKKIGRVPRSYAEVAYDAFWVAALTENVTAGTNDINFLKKMFLQLSNSYARITGDTSLNEAGDRKQGDYDFWAIRPNNGNSNSNDQSCFAWGLVGRFQSNTNIKDTGLIQQIKSIR